MKDSLDFIREAKTLEEMDQLHYFLMQTSETYNKIVKYIIPIVDVLKKVS
jgi:hypothetical protein